VVGDPAIVRKPMESLGIGPVMQAEMAE